MVQKEEPSLSLGERTVLLWERRLLGRGVGVSRSSASEGLYAPHTSMEKELKRNKNSIVLEVRGRRYST